MPPSENPQFADLLKRERQRSGFTIRHLAEATGVAPTTLFRLESGQSKPPSPEVLNRLAFALGVEVEEFYAAVGITTSGLLPELGTYLRTKYGVTDADASRVEGYLQALRQSHDDTSPKEGHDDEPGGNTP